MSSKVKLTYTSNPKLAELIGHTGEIKPNDRGGYSISFDNGKVVSTSPILPNTTLGDYNYPACKEFSFNTSGSSYVFETNLDREKLLDGVQKRDNQFLGFNNSDKTDDFEPDI